MIELQSGRISIAEIDNRLISLTNLFVYSARASALPGPYIRACSRKLKSGRDARAPVRGRPARSSYSRKSALILLPTPLQLRDRFIAIQPSTKRRTRRQDVAFNGELEI